MKFNPSKSVQGLLDELTANGKILNFENAIKPWKDIFGEENIIVKPHDHKRNTFSTLCPHTWLGDILGLYAPRVSATKSVPDQNHLFLNIGLGYALCRHGIINYNHDCTPQLHI